MNDPHSETDPQESASEEAAHEAETKPHSSEGGEPDLMSAFEDFKGAAQRLLGQALREESLQTAAREAERTLGQVAAAAEPVARHLSEELARVGKGFGASLTDAIRAKTKPVNQTSDSPTDDEPDSDSAPTSSEPETF